MSPCVNKKRLIGGDYRSVARDLDSPTFTLKMGRVLRAKLPHFEEFAYVLRILSG